MSEPADDAERTPELPPLEIHHVLVFTAVVVATFKMNGHWFGDEWSLSSMTFYDVVSQVSRCLGVTLLFFGVLEIQWSLSTLKQPGHGLILLIGISYLLSLMAIASFSNFIPNFGQEDLAHEEIPLIVKWVIKWLLTIRLIADGALAIMCVKWFSQWYRWKMYYLLIAVISFAQAAVFVLYKADAWMLPEAVFQVLYYWIKPILEFGGPFVFMTTLLWIVILDRIQRKQYHWSHWCGVLGFLLPICVGLTTGIFQYFNPTDWTAYSP